MNKSKFTLPFESVTIDHLPIVGGKNASLGEMTQKLAGVRVPPGFAIVADGYRYFLKQNGIDEQILQTLAVLKQDKSNLEHVGNTIRTLILNAAFPNDLSAQILQAYHQLCNKCAQKNTDVAVRSSATAEDLPDASFAGQQDTYLNISGDAQVLQACKKVYASLFTNRAISYRMDKGYDHSNVALSVGIQKMVRSDKATSGVMFTLDTESGFDQVLFITGSYGLGENVVQGSVNPDEYYVHKPTFCQGYKPILKKRLGSKQQKMIYTSTGTDNVPVALPDQKRFCLNDKEILDLARMGMIIEHHYSKSKGSKCPMDIEWAQDADGVIYIVQARPETVHSQAKKNNFIEDYELCKTTKKVTIVQGRSIGKKIVSGIARVCHNLEELKTLQEGEIIVTDQTDPDMEPYMRIAGGILTQKGGRTCHSAIISRELGIPCIVGAEYACKHVQNGQMITLDCSSGEVGNVYKGAIPFIVNTRIIGEMPKLKTNIMMNVANPDEVFNVAQLPNEGVGLARLEFIINNTIRIHPMALIQNAKVQDAADQNLIQDLLAVSPEYKNNMAKYFVDKLAQEAGTIAAAFYPKPVIFRMSDFKSNEYYQLIGGKFFEPSEENPMIGFRGASRYYHSNYKEAFALECQAMKKMREEMGMTNARLMLPFVRTVQEAEQVQQEMAKYGLKRGVNELEMYMMIEIPSNVILVDQFAKLFDGFSIGSNDLTQMTLGVDRDSPLIAPLFDERNEAVKIMLRMAIEGAKRNKRKIGICGQAPSDYPEMAQFLMSLNIDSISLTPDTVIKTWMLLANKLADA